LFIRKQHIYTIVVCAGYDTHIVRKRIIGSNKPGDMTLQQAKRTLCHWWRDIRSPAFAYLTYAYNMHAGYMRYITYVRISHSIRMPALPTGSNSSTQPRLGSKLFTHTHIAYLITWCMVTSDTIRHTYSTLISSDYYADTAWAMDLLVPCIVEGRSELRNYQSCELQDTLATLSWLRNTLLTERIYRLAEHSYLLYDSSLYVDCSALGWECFHIRILHTYVSHIYILSLSMSREMFHRYIFP
jgi:hypothetical protein